LRYTRDLCALVPLDEAATNAAIHLQQAATQRMPLVEDLIAGCAASRNLTLAHGNEHLDALPVRSTHHAASAVQATAVRGVNPPRVPDPRDR
jgi:hypothetical protein